ncbi:conserved Plasmodium protein, unknown function [Plasmodium malariae]|uniref:Uncharacterized protein n=1 Tax=Plasmodium malariae TaxID=5858 RepID=A0A1D3SPM5_PLAMA|nr:conserved Plasmodium protein, unknown function [Plasmodium malariae]SCO93335.1 conserved Plasmodium protein, unknown function [Plasmodium malariae]
MKSCYVIKKIYKYEQVYKKLHKCINIGINNKSTLHSNNCAHKFLINQVRKINNKFVLHTNKRTSVKHLTINSYPSFQNGIYCIYKAFRNNSGIDNTAERVSIKCSDWYHSKGEEKKEKIKEEKEDATNKINKEEKEEATNKINKEEKEEATNRINKEEKEETTNRINKEEKEETTNRINKEEKEETTNRINKEEKEETTNRINKEEKEETTNRINKEEKEETTNRINKEEKEETTNRINKKEKKTDPLFNDLNRISLLSSHHPMKISIISNKMRRIKFRSFTQIAVSIKKDKCIKFSRLSLSELLNFINKNLSQDNDIKTWNNIFVQVDKLISKKTKNEQHKREINSFFEKLKNIDYYVLLYNLKNVDECTKNNILNSLFFECFVLCLRRRDITYSYEKDNKIHDMVEESIEGGNEKGDDINLEKKNESKVKSYMKNLKTFLSITSSRRNVKEQTMNMRNDEKGNKEKERSLSFTKSCEEKRLEFLHTLEKVEKDENNMSMPVSIGLDEDSPHKFHSHNTCDRDITKKERREVDVVTAKGTNDTVNVSTKRAKNVKMIKRWFNLLTYFSNKCENMLILKEYLNKIFRQNIDELIHLNYFSKTVHHLTNQINSKSVHAIILTYEQKLCYMKPYDFSYSLIILLRFLILNHNLFNSIINYAIDNPLSKFQNEKFFIRFIKSVDNYPLIYPSNINYNNTEFFQANMNDLYNFTFSIFIKKLSTHLKYYSINNLLFLSECLSKVIFMPNTQNQTLHIFINKLRYYIDDSIDLLSVDNFMLIRLFRIYSFFSFVPEMEVFVDNTPKKNTRGSRKCITNPNVLGLSHEQIKAPDLRICSNNVSDVSVRGLAGRSSIDITNQTSDKLEKGEDIRGKVINEPNKVEMNGCTGTRSVCKEEMAKSRKSLEEIRVKGEDGEMGEQINGAVDEPLNNVTEELPIHKRDASLKKEQCGKDGEKMTNINECRKSIMKENQCSGGKKILKHKTDESTEEKSKKKSLCFNMNEKKVINYYYEKSEESDSFHINHFLTSYDIYQVKGSRYKINKYLLNYNMNHEQNKKYRKNKLLLKNIVLSLCSHIDKNLEEIAKELRKMKNECGGIRKQCTDATYASLDLSQVNMEKDNLIEEIKRMNEKNEVSKRNDDDSAENFTVKEKSANSELYNSYLIFYDIKILSEIVKFTHFSINTNKYTYELIKSIKKRLEEIITICNIKDDVNNEKAKKKKKKKKNEEQAKIQNITTFQLYNFYCACKNFSPSFLFGFFDILLKLTPKINVIDIDKCGDIFNKKNIYKMEYLKFFEKIMNKNITIPFIVSLLHLLKIIISSNLFLSNNLLHEHVSTMVQYSYYVLLYYCYNKNKRKHVKNVDVLGNTIKEIYADDDMMINAETLFENPLYDSTTGKELLSTATNEDINNEGKDSTYSYNYDNFSSSAVDEYTYAYRNYDHYDQAVAEKPSSSHFEAYENNKSVKQNVHVVENKTVAHSSTYEEANVNDKLLYERNYNDNGCIRTGNWMHSISNENMLMGNSGMNREKEKMKIVDTNEYIDFNDNNHSIFDDRSDCSAISNIMKFNKNSKKLCIFEDLYLDDICNIYLCLSTSLYFLNRTEEKSNEIKHLIYLENKFLKLVSKERYMKYLSDNFIFFLFKAPSTCKLEQVFDNIIPSLKIINRMRSKTSEILSSFTHSVNMKFLSLPAATAFFICKIKLSMASSSTRQINIVRMENTKKLFGILIDDYKLLSKCIEELFINKRKGVDAPVGSGGRAGTDDYVDHYGDTGASAGTGQVKCRYRCRWLNIEMSGSHQRETQRSMKNSGTEKNNKFSHFNKKRKKFSYLPYLISNKSTINQNVYFKTLIGDMFFGIHEVKTLYDLQNTLLKTVKHLEMSQINLNVNYKITQITPIHNDMLSYLSELANVVKECLYIIFLSQPYIHKSPKKYTTKSLVNYFINKCKFVKDYNVFDDCNNKSINDLKSNKYMTNEICS